MVFHNSRVFLFLLDRKAPARRSSEVLSDFVEVIVTAIVCLAPVVVVNLPETQRKTQRWPSVGRSVEPAFIGQAEKNSS